MHESSGSLSLSPRSTALEFRKGSTNGIADFSGLFSRAFYRVQPQLYEKLKPREVDNPNLVRYSGLYLLRTRGLRAPSSPFPGVGLGGLAPSLKELS